MLRDAMRDLDLPVKTIATALAEAIDDDTESGRYALKRVRLDVSCRASRTASSLCWVPWAARKQGAVVPVVVWKRHAHALGEEQTSTGLMALASRQVAEGDGAPARIRVSTRAFLWVGTRASPTCAWRVRR